MAKEFIIGETYVCASYQTEYNIFRVTNRSNGKVELSMLLEREDETFDEKSFGEREIEIVDDCEYVLMEQDYFDENCKIYLSADSPFTI